MDAAAIAHGRRAVVGMALAVSLSVPAYCRAPPPSASARTEDNLLFLEAWRAVDHAYYDKSFNGQSWFRYREPMNTREETWSDYSDRLLQQPLRCMLQNPFLVLLLTDWDGGDLPCRNRGRLGLTTTTTVPYNKGSPAEAGSCNSRGGVGNGSNKTAIWPSFMFRRKLQDEVGRKIVLAHWS